MTTTIKLTIKPFHRCAYDVLYFDCASIEEFKDIIGYQLYLPNCFVPSAFKTGPNNKRKRIKVKHLVPVENIIHFEEVEV